MDFSQFYFADILHSISTFLLYPDMALLIGCILMALFEIGSILVENFSEHRHLKAKIPELLDSIDAARVDDLDNVVNSSGLLRRQREALHGLIVHKQLPEDSLIALAKQYLTEEEEHYDRITERSTLLSKIGPMLGLMGTLIPLGPGIIALSSGDVNTLSSSLLVAFDTTVAGLAAAAVALIVTKIRTRWYDMYSAALESVMTAMLERLTREGK